MPSMQGDCMRAVFEATMTQFTSIQYDLREMRADIKELLKNKQ